MSKSLMIQGTMSSAGKSLIAAGLCRIFKQDGYRVAPFKSQNMALNSYITEEGLEMGRAQVMQAEAAGVRPSVLMNPILLKPTNDTGSQVIVGGEVLGNMKAKDYFAYKKNLVPQIRSAYERLASRNDIIVIEGAGSPAEINLKENDIVNMGMAKISDSPVLLVGDIDRGGVFAQLLGTMMLLEKEEQERVKGLIINKFRGDRSILDPGVAMLEERCGKKVAGVVPYVRLALEDEDSLTARFDRKGAARIDIAVIRFPRISNFTDFDVFEQFEGVSLRYVTGPGELGNPDMILLPGSKNTMGDLKWMRQNGLEACIKKRKEETVIFGICGGYQMLGKKLTDPLSIEEGGEIRGMELLPIETELRQEKTRTRVSGKFLSFGGILAAVSEKELSGYEIHMGVSRMEETCRPVCFLTDTISGEQKEDGCARGNVYGTYVHGIFDRGDIASVIIKILAEKKGVTLDFDGQPDYAAFKETQYDRLAEVLREHLDMEYIYGLLNLPYQEKGNGYDEGRTVSNRN